MKNKITGYKLTQNKKSGLQFLSEWIDLKTDKSDETATMIIEKITEMLKEKKNYKAETQTEKNLAWFLPRHTFLGSDLASHIYDIP